MPEDLDCVCNNLDFHGLLPNVQLEAINNGALPKTPHDGGSLPSEILHDHYTRYNKIGSCEQDTNLLYILLSVFIRVQAALSSRYRSHKTWKSRDIAFTTTKELSLLRSNALDVITRLTRARSPTVNSEESGTVAWPVAVVVGPSDRRQRQSPGLNRRRRFALTLHSPPDITPQ